ncbi:hypothetical protein KAW18_01295 [candidate division WOR-3 bacterium]|nr:hypothetical protein [candidate division WOR-3 bacterium]
MKEIQLTQGKIALVDDLDFEILNQFKWYANKMGNVYYAIRALSWEDGKRQMLRMHHAVIGYPSMGSYVDHENGNGLHNYKSNLRFVTRRQNLQNRIHGKTKISKYPGITWFPECKKWRARIQKNGKRMHLGLFNSELDAFNAYCDAVHVFGETMIGSWV